MRNLKRVLSLALAAIMLMGMMVMGTSAKDISDFPDADEIDDYAREAVAITTGLGIFAGEAGTGKFNPNGTVTRAQLATIICKILVLEGTVDYNLLKGSANSFPDARTHEGGWAEGYINYCQATGIVRGYPNGNFGAKDEVITWHAALALERAIGYYRENEKNNETLDETVVTSKGIEIGLYGDMSLPIDHVLTRQELAVMVYNALFAQRVEYRSGNYVKANDWNVVPNNSTNDPYNTLAYGTFYLVAADGVVMRNSAVDPTLAGTDKVGASTMVDMYDKDHKLTGVLRSFEYDTGTDLIGHAVTVYYSVSHKVKNVTVPEKVYAMTDQATATGMITYATLSGNKGMDYTTMNRAAVEQGFKSRTLGDDAQEYNINYDLDVKVKDTWFKDGGNAKNDIKKGDYILLISNQPTKEVEYAIVLKQYVDEVKVNTNRFEETVNSVSTFSLNSLYLQDELADGDDVIVTPNYFDGSGMPKHAVVQAADLQSATVEEVVGVSETSNTYRTVTADGVKYTESPVSTANMPSGYTPFQKISQLTETTLVRDLYGKLIAITQDKAKPNTELVYVSQFGYKYGEISSLKDQVILKAEVWHADGTCNAIVVNTKATIVDGVITKNETDASIIRALLTNTNTIDIEANYKKLNAAGSEPNKDGVAYDNGGTFLGVWQIKELTDGTYSLNKPASVNAAQRGQKYILASNNTAQAGSEQADQAVRIMTGHSTFLQGSNNSSHATLTDWTATSQQQYKDALLQTNSTIYWYVDGNYENGDLSVTASVGVSSQSNVILHGNPGDNDGTWAEEAWVDIDTFNADGTVKEAGKGNHQIKAMVIHGVGAVDDLGVCYYDQGSWSIRNVNGEYIVTFQAFNADGEEVYFSYNYKNYTDAELASRGANGLVNPTDVTKSINDDGKTEYSIPSGYYTFYSNKIVAVSDSHSQYAVVAGSNAGKEILNGSEYTGTVYVADATVAGTNKVTDDNHLGQMKDIYNLFTPATPQGIIYTDARVIDLKNDVYNSVNGLYDAMKDNVIEKVQISYSYSRSNYQCPVLYVVDYDYTSVAGGGSTSGDIVKGDYGDALDGTTVRYHQDDLAAYGGRKGYVEAVLSQATGMTCTYNTFTHQVRFSDGTTTSVTLQEMFKITVQVPDGNNGFKSYETYLAADGTNPKGTKDKATATGATGQYVEQGVPSGGYAASAGLITMNAASTAIERDMVLVPAVQISGIDTTTIDSVKLGDYPVDTTNDYVPKGASLTVTGKMTTTTDASAKFIGLEYTVTDDANPKPSGVVANGDKPQVYTVKVDKDITVLAEKRMYKVITPDGKTAYGADSTGKVEFASAAEKTNVMYLNDSNVATATNGTVTKSGNTMTYAVASGDANTSTDTITLVERYTLSWPASSKLSKVTVNGTDTPVTSSAGSVFVAKGDKIVVTGTAQGSAKFVGLTLTVGGDTTSIQGDAVTNKTAKRVYAAFTISADTKVVEAEMYKVTGLGTDTIVPNGTPLTLTGVPKGLKDANICINNDGDLSEPNGTASLDRDEDTYTVDSNDATDGIINLAIGYKLPQVTNLQYYKKLDSTGTDVTGSALANNCYVLPGTYYIKTSANYKPNDAGSTKITSTIVEATKTVGGIYKITITNADFDTIVLEKVDPTTP